MDGPRPSILDALEHEPVVWLSTTRPDGGPHVVPLWFVWDGRSIVAFSKPHAQKVRNLRADPRVMVAVGRADASFDVELIEAVAELHDTSAALPRGIRQEIRLTRRGGRDRIPGLRRRVLAGDRDPPTALAWLGRRRLGWLISSWKVGSPCELTRRRAEEAAEPAREVRLIGEPDFGRDVGQRLTGEDPVAGGIETPSGTAVGIGALTLAVAAGLEPSSRRSRRLPSR